MNTHGCIRLATHQNNALFHFEGDVRVTLSASLDQCIGELFANGCQQIFVDLTAAVNLDSTALGVLARIPLHQRQVRRAIMICPSEDLQLLLASMGLIDQFDLRDDWNGEPFPLDTPLHCLTEVSEPDITLQMLVIDAHKRLMSMHTDNQERFAGLVADMERQLRW
ncbi:Uncharacterised protein [BD1-7 clade bacterium]|uniref:STAS domain-containing protein n=1 Tax=BD1-7 clade bacterium TaxID=2029982 RepID=A0A5S9P1Z0_9GAMM|nr:Uncharacterised protein [BD1-7 clade bacterium]CAA0122632.1 Uncharacterised protein [BD1-7 clade bacterium]